MKQTFKYLLIIMLISIIGACGSMNAEGVKDMNETTESKVVNGTPHTSDTKLAQNEDDVYIKEKMQLLNFSEIEVEVNYADNKEYEFNIEQDVNEPIEVKLDNELANEFLQGRKAFDVLYPKLDILNIKSDTRETEIIDQLLTAFDLPTDYVKIEVEITFNDGKKVDFEHRK